mmetsp:Transcript_9677/g.28039  ORF Transcript_9677/g.28039 Transcript_9677/m.28039 type:complete len:343 (-) Transcript_9677:504-1532(-)
MVAEVPQAMMLWRRCEQRQVVHLLRLYSPTTLALPRLIRKTIALVGAPRPRRATVAGAPCFEWAENPVLRGAHRVPSEEPELQLVTCVVPRECRTVRGRQFRAPARNRRATSPARGHEGAVHIDEEGVLRAIVAGAQALDHVDPHRLVCRRQPAHIAEELRDGRMDGLWLQGDAGGGHAAIVAGEVAEGDRGPMGLGVPRALGAFALLPRHDARLHRCVGWSAHLQLRVRFTQFRQVVDHVSQNANTTEGAAHHRVAIFRQGIRRSQRMAHRRGAADGGGGRAKDRHVVVEHAMLQILPSSVEVQRHADVVVCQQHRLNLHVRALIHGDYASMTVLPSNRAV